jgi:uncharacterized protein YprB with RNaseH-like and TPR domain
MDLSSRLRAIVKGGPPKPVRELTYEPDTGGYEAVMDISRVGAILGGRPADTPFGQCLVIDRRYEADRFHGSVRIGECAVEDCSALGVLDPSLGRAADQDQSAVAGLRTFSRTVFIDLETTGLSGGAGTVAFLGGCGYFDLGAFQVRQILLTSYASERALLHAVAAFFDDVDLIVTYNGKTFDVPVMETRWLFHRLQMPLTEVPHFDMLHPARRLWRMRAGSGGEIADSGCRLTTLEPTLFDVTRVGDVDGFEIPARFFRFLRSGDPRPLEPVLEHNRLDLMSLAAVMARGVQLAREGHEACRDDAEALALGRVYERAGRDERLDDRACALGRAEACYRRAAESSAPDVRGEALYRLGLRHRRERRFADAAAIWRDVVELTEPRRVRRMAGLRELRQFAVEALAIHHEHRERDLAGARELALFALEEADGRRADGMRHRIARIDRKMSVRRERKMAQNRDAQLFTS